MSSRESYDAYYTDQGWLMEDHTHLPLNDELDELQSPNLLTHDLIWNAKDLTKPYLIGPCCFEAELVADHNLHL